LQVDVNGVVESMDCALHERKLAEKHYIKQLFHDKKISPRSYKSKRVALEKWVGKERKQIQKTKH
jgi:hypothetical protein